MRLPGPVSPGLSVEPRPCLPWSSEDLWVGRVEASEAGSRVGPVCLEGAGHGRTGAGWGRDPRTLTQLSIQGEPPGMPLCSLNLGAFVFRLYPDPLASWASV